MYSWILWAKNNTLSRYLCPRMSENQIITYSSKYFGEVYQKLFYINQICQELGGGETYTSPSAYTKS